MQPLTLTIAILFRHGDLFTSTTVFSEFRNNFRQPYVSRSNHEFYRVEQMKRDNLKSTNNISKVFLVGISAVVLMTTMVEKALADLPNGIYRIRPTASTKYLDATSADISTNGTRFQLWDYLGGLNQHFLIEASGTPGVHRIRLAASRKAFDAAYPTMHTNGGPIILWDHDPGAGATQKWRIEPIPGSTSHTIRLASNGRSLDAGADTITQNGGVVQLFNFLGSGRWNQQWVIEQVPGLRVIPRSTWLPRLQTVFNQTSLRLNNFTPTRNGFSSIPGQEYFRPNDSFFTTVIGGRPFRLPIPIPVIRRDPSSIYVDDMNTTRITAGFTGASNGYDSGKLRINLAFESDGREFWTNCVNNAGCFAIGNRDIQMNNAVFQINLEPIAEAGGISYRNNVDTTLSADTSVSGCSRDLFAFLCDMFAPNAGSEIQRNVEGTVEGFFNRPTFRPVISAVLSDQLGVIPSTPLRSVRIYQNGDLEMIQP